MDDMLATAIIRTSFGVKGHLKLTLFSEDYKHLKDLKTVLLKKDRRTKELEIEEVRKSGKDVLIKFVNIDSPEKAKLLNGYTIYVPRENASKLKKGEIYLSDLIGCNLTVKGENIGVITTFYEGAQAPLLEVKLESKTILVPYMAVFVKEADLENKTLELQNEDLLL